MSTAFDASRRGTFPWDGSFFGKGAFQVWRSAKKHSSDCCDTSNGVRR